MLKCVSRYSSDAGRYEPGDFIDDPRLEDALLRDSRESFAPVESREQEVEIVERAPAPRVRSIRK